MTGSQIKYVRARRVWDSRGRPTIEAEVETNSGARGRAIAPAGASKGQFEALERRDGGKALLGLDVLNAVTQANELIANRLAGMDSKDQAAIDQAMIELDGTAQRSQLGANAMIAVSMACAQAAASANNLPLWRQLLADAPCPPLPLPEIQIIGGGAHAGRRIDIQDMMVVCPGAQTICESFEWTAEIYHKAGSLLAEAGKLQGVADEGGFWPAFDRNEEALDWLLRAIETAGFRPGEQVVISLDIAASEFGRDGTYKLARDERELSSDQMIELLVDWCGRYPILSIEDGLGEDDPQGHASLNRKIGQQIQLVGDDLLVTDAAKVRSAAQSGLANAVLIKPNQRGTLSETLECWQTAKTYGLGGIVSARSGETEDVTICHLALGWGIPQIKVGSFARSERVAKWNELIRLEEALGADARFAGWSPFSSAKASASSSFQA